MAQASDSQGIFKILAILRAVCMAVAGLLVAAGAGHAGTKAIDYRVIFIDNALYSAIQDADERRRALDHLLADLTMFDLNENAVAVETVVFMRAGQLGDFIDQEFVTPAGGNVADDLARNDKFQEMQAGTVGYKAGLDIDVLRKQIHGFLNSINTGNVDIHIFAASWSAGKSQLRNMMKQLLPSSCVARGDTAPTLVPDGIDITIELRAPEKAQQPSDAALANLIALIAGTSEQRPNVHSRGVAGPLCPMQDSVIAKGYDPDPNGTAAQDCIPLPLTVTPAAYRACRAPLVPAAGQVDRSPVRLTASDRDMTLDKVTFEVRTAPEGFAMDVQIAGVAVPTGGTVGLGGTVAAGVYEAWLTLTPDPSCVQAAGADLRLGALGGPAMQVVTSQISCTGSRLRLADVHVR